MTASSAVPLVAIVVHTGTGKSGLSLELVEGLEESGIPAEIVNADAMQLYRGMDIGTAKLAVDERRGIPHHLLDVLAVTETSTVADYQSAARAAIEDIRTRGAVPVLVGGSGLYLSAVLHDLRFPGTDEEIRAGLETELVAAGAAVLWERLRALDPVAADSIDPANGRRVVRALEVVALTGAPYSASLAEGEYRVPTQVLSLDVAEDERPLLKERLAGRARGMFDNGLLDEVRELQRQGLEQGTTAPRAIGYAQALAVVTGRQALEDAVEETIRLTWRYVRRQRSWFARDAAALRLRVGESAVLERALGALLDPSSRP